MKKVVISLLVLVLLVVGGVSVAAKSERSGGMAATAQLQAAPNAVLGIVVRNLNKPLATRLGLEKDSGVVITQVQFGSPAEKASLKVKDIITAVNNTPVATVAELKKLVPTTPVQVALTILRGKDTLTINVTPAPRKDWAMVNPPAWLPELGGIKAAERFEHNLGGQWSFLDKDGKKHTVTTTPGVVKEVKDNTLTITPNGQTTTVSFTTSDKTLIRVAGGKLSGLKAGDKVTVLTVDNSQEARVITSGGGMGNRFFAMRGAMKPGVGHRLNIAPKQLRPQNKIERPNPARAPIPNVIQTAPI
ncbi:MAG: PDZ domain-containing protein [Dehalococcoidia bacterium]|nr:PDZ domain-containing protein [Dehalococcoidia bacterium]